VKALSLIRFHSFVIEGPHQSRALRLSITVLVLAKLDEGAGLGSLISVRTIY